MVASKWELLYSESFKGWDDKTPLGYVCFNRKSNLLEMYDLTGQYTHSLPIGEKVKEKFNITLKRLRSRPLPVEQNNQQAIMQNTPAKSLTDLIRETESN